MCLTTVILALGASEGWMRVAGQVTPRADWRDPGDPRKFPGVYSLCADCIVENHSLGIGVPVLSKRYYMPLGRKRRPPWQRRAPKWSKGCPQGEEREVKRHSKETNKSEKYTHIFEIYASSRFIAIQRPAIIYYTLLLLSLNT